MEGIDEDKSHYENDYRDRLKQFSIESHIPPIVGANTLLPMASVLLCCQYRTDIAFENKAFCEP